MTNPTISWYGHDSFAIFDGQTLIYIDPWQLPAGLLAGDIVLVTHEHADHCSLEDIHAISKPSTQVVAAAVCAEALASLSPRLVTPGDRLTIGPIQIDTVPAYNTNKFREPGKLFHPSGEQRVGYIVSIGGQRIYHAGDTDHIPEMKNLRPDIALLPVSGTYVMTAEEAAAAARDIVPGTAVPMHYGRIVGTIDDANRFVTLISPSIKTIILPEKK